MGEIIAGATRLVALNANYQLTGKSAEAVETIVNATLDRRPPPVQVKVFVAPGGDSLMKNSVHQADTYTCGVMETL